MSARDIAKQLIELNLCPVPVDFKKKTPTVRDWQKLTCDEVSNRFEELFPENRQLNVGCLLGEPSGGIVDIDLDWPEDAELAPFFLPSTRGFGRDGAPWSHWLYRVATPGKPFKISPPRKPDTASGRKPDILEFRSTGQQTVWPGSTHLSGEIIRWEKSQPDFTEVNLEALVEQLKLLAVASYLVSIWGICSRDELTSALAGGLLRDGLDRGAVDKLLNAVMTIAKDEEKKNRLRKLDRIAELVSGNKKGRQYGWPKVAELIGDDVADWIKKLIRPEVNDSRIRSDSSELIAELNKRHAIVKIGGRVWVMNEEEADPVTGYLDVTFSTTSDLRTLYANRPVEISNGNGSVRKVSLVDLWLKSPDRREYKGLIFEPREEGIPGYFNLWRGWLVKPVKGNCSLFLKHIHDNIAGGNEEYYRWIEGWMADAVQNPTKRPGTAIVLRGGQGTGKGTFANFFGQLFGQHYTQVNSARHLVGHFNSHLKDCSLIFADEAFWAGDRTAEGILKGLVTEERILIEQKGKDVIQIRSYLRLICASNHDWVVPAGFDERRFAVFDVKDMHKQDREYFGAIVQQMSNGGLEALMYHLLNVDLGPIDVARIPNTDALEDNKRRSADPLVRWAVGQLENGSQLKDSDEWLIHIRCGELWEDFKTATKDERHYSPARAHENEFAKMYRKLLPNIVRVKIFDSHSQKRCWAWQFPLLDTCISDFEARTGLTILRQNSIKGSDLQIGSEPEF